MQLGCFMFPLNIQEKLWSYRKCQKKKVQGRLGRFMTKKLAFLHNPEQNIWDKVKRTIKIGLDQKTLLSAFTYFLTALAQAFFLEGRLGTRLFLCPNFVRSYVLSRSVIPEVTRMQRFLHQISCSVLLVGNRTCTKTF